MPLEFIQGLVVLQLPCELEQLQLFVCFLSWGVPNRLTLLVNLWFVLLCYLPWHHGYQRVFTDVCCTVKNPFTQALFYDFSYGHLRQCARVNLFHLL